MLRGIDPLLGPELLYTLASMGHGDAIAVVDRNFPAMSHHARVLRLDGVDTGPALRAVLSLLPLDTYTDEPLRYMADPGAPDGTNELHHEAIGIARSVGGMSAPATPVERFRFYDAARAAYAVVVTGEHRPYGCFLLAKGVLP